MQTVARLTLFSAAVAICLSATPLYTIQPLLDPARPNGPFFIPQTAQSQFPVNNTVYLGGTTSNNSAAIGTLNGSSFSYTPLPPLSGDSSSSVLTTLKDGSALGFSVQSNPFFRQTLVRWTAGMPTPIILADPQHPSAVFPPGSLAANSQGDIVGTSSLNGTLSAFRYNVFSNTFTSIPSPNASATVIYPLGVTNSGKMLFVTNPGPAVIAIYDPSTLAWTSASVPSGLGFTGFGILNSAGAFVTSLQDFSSNDTVPYSWVGGSWTPLVPLVPYNGTNTTRNVLAYNASGLLVGSRNSELGTYSGGAFQDLFSRIVNQAGWTSFAFGPALVSGANDAGQIFGDGLYNGVSTAFALTPVADTSVPEPATFALIGPAVVLLLLKRR